LGPHRPCPATRLHTAVNAADAAARFDEFHTIWGTRYLAINELWDAAWAEFVPPRGHCAPQAERPVKSESATSSFAIASGDQVVPIGGESAATSWRTNRAG
jgi:hypothetical protein